MYAAPNRRTTPPAGRARRAGAVLDAGAGRVPGHVRARGGDGRAGRTPRHRPGRAAHPQRARGRPGDRQAVVEPAPRRVPARGRASASAGPTATRGPAVGATGDWLVGTGVASLGLPDDAPGRVDGDASAYEDGRYVAEIGAADLGTGAWTVAPADRGRRARRAASTTSRCRSATPRYPDGVGRGRLVGHQHVGLGDRRRRRARSGDKFGGRPDDGDEADGRRRPGREGRRRTPATPSARSSPRRGSTPTPARSGCRGCWASSPPDGSSTRARPARSSSAA